MSKSVTEEQSKRTAAFIKEVIEPKINKMIEEANKVLRKRGVQVGASVEWFIDKHGSEPEGTQDGT